jgi:hypothetical protein
LFIGTLTFFFKLERALTLWKEGIITIESREKDTLMKKTKSGMKGIQGSINKETGKVSSTKLTFADSNWGEKTRAYMQSIAKGVTPKKWAKILDATKYYVISKPDRGSSVIPSCFDEEDARAMIVVSDDD